MIGQTISHYRIIERLGAGGMGVVYLAEDTVLGRKVAIKTLTDTTGPGNQHFRIRFLREARAVSTLSHPHIATIHDYGETPEGQPYIVMEFIRGETLADLMLKESLTIPRALEIISEVAEALGEAHGHGIIHRDIKPSNVAINQRGEVKVLDFGLAKQVDLSPAGSDPERQTLLNTQTREGVIVGTPMYLSPEQALGVEVDARSDLFSLGGVLYECLAGKPPFFGGGPMEICAKVIRDDPLPPSQFNADVPGELDRIALKALAKRPEERYQTAGEMIADLDTARLQVRGYNQTITRTVRATPGTQPTGALATLSDIFKRPRLSVGYVVLSILAVALIAFGLWYALKPTPHLPTAEAQAFYARGVTALREGAYLTASKQLAKAVAADKDFALAHARLAEAWTELDYQDRAKDELLNVNQLERTTLTPMEKLYLEAITATVKRDFPAAINSYQQLLKLRTDDAAAYIDLGRAYKNNEDIDRALENFSEATRRDPEAAAAYLQLGILNFRKQNTAGATAAFDRAERIYQDANNFEGQAETVFQRGLLLKQRGELQPARELLQKALDIARIADSKSQQVKTRLQLSGISYLEGKTTEAKQQANEAIAIARANDLENLSTEGLLDLGYAFFVSRSYSEAEEYFRQALDISQRNKGRRNEARAQMSLGALYIQQEQFEKGQPYIEQALTFYRSADYRREISQGLIWSGRAQLLKGDYEGAIKTLDEQLQLAKQVDDPAQLARSQEELASALGKLELYPQALVRYTESYQLYKSLNNSMHVAFCLLNRADMLARLGRYDEANTALDELKPFLDQLSDDNRSKSIWRAWIYLIRAQMSLAERRFAETTTFCEQALAVIAADRKALRNTEIGIKATLGLAKVFLGQIAIGLSLCKEAVTLTALGEQRSTDDADVKLILAEALLESGDAKRALAAAQQAQLALAARHRKESEWRAWLMAARASHRLESADSMREQQSRAASILAKLEHDWGTEAFDTYASRSDIQTYRKQLGER